MDVSLSYCACLWVYDCINVFQWMRDLCFWWIHAVFTFAQYKIHILELQFIRGNLFIRGNTFPVFKGHSLGGKSSLTRGPKTLLGFLVQVMWPCAVHLPEDCGGVASTWGATSERQEEIFTLGAHFIVFSATQCDLQAEVKQEVGIQNKRLIYVPHETLLV